MATLYSSRNPNKPPSYRTCTRKHLPVKYGGGSNLIWDPFAVSGPGTLAIVEGKVTRFIKDNVGVAVG